MNINEDITKKLEEVTRQSDASPKFGALIVKNGKIISSGFAHKSDTESSVKDHELLLIHAEESALLKALGENVDISGSDIYVFGIRDNDDIRYSDFSYSCVVCSRLLKQSNIANIFYPTPEGWNKVTTDEIFEKAINRIEVGKI